MDLPSIKEVLWFVSSGILLSGYCSTSMGVETSTLLHVSVSTASAGSIFLLKTLFDTSCLALLGTSPGALGGGETVATPSMSSAPLLGTSSPSLPRLPLSLSQTAEKFAT